jgi:hypothetical protein
MNLFWNYEKITENIMGSLRDLSSTNTIEGPQITIIYVCQLLAKVSANRAGRKKEEDREPAEDAE